MNDELFLAEFEGCSWPFERWHHREHIKAAYLYLCRHPFDTAVEKMRAGVKAYNTAHHRQSSQRKPDAPEKHTSHSPHQDSGVPGYHETITQAWMRLVNATLEEFGPSESADSFMDRHLQLLSKDALLRFYSRDWLMSAEARATFVAPDLTSLPEARKKGHASTRAAA